MEVKVTLDTAARHGNKEKKHEVVVVEGGGGQERPTHHIKKKCCRSKEAFLFLYSALLQFADGFKD